MYGEKPMMICSSQISSAFDQREHDVSTLIESCPMERSVRTESLNGIWIGTIAEENVDYLKRERERTQFVNAKCMRMRRVTERI